MGDPIIRLLHEKLPDIYEATLDQIEAFLKKHGPKPTDEDAELAALMVFDEEYGELYKELDRRLKLTVAYAKERDKEWTVKPSATTWEKHYTENRHPLSRTEGRREHQKVAAKKFESIHENAGNVTSFAAGMYTSIKTKKALKELKKESAELHRIAIDEIVSEYGVARADAWRQPWSAIFITACFRRALGPADDQIDLNDGFLPEQAHYRYFLQGYKNARVGDLKKPFWTSGRSEVPISAGDLISKTWSSSDSPGLLKFNNEHNKDHQTHWEAIRADWDAVIEKKKKNIERWTRNTHSDLVIYVGPLAAGKTAKANGNFAVTLGGNTRDVREPAFDTVGMKIYRLDKNGFIQDEVERNLEDPVSTNTSYAVVHRPTRLQRIEWTQKRHPEAVKETIEKILVERLQLKIDAALDEVKDDNNKPIEGDFPDPGVVPFN